MTDTPKGTPTRRVVPNERSVATLRSMVFSVVAPTAEAALSQAAQHAPILAFRSTTEQEGPDVWMVTLEFKRPAGAGGEAALPLGGAAGGRIPT